MFYVENGIALSVAVCPNCPSSLDFFYKIRTFAADLIEFKYLWTVQP